MAANHMPAGGPWSKGYRFNKFPAVDSRERRGDYETGLKLE
jgi:hypothetical protein